MSERIDDELGGALRAMLADRAQDVDVLPERFTDLPALAGSDAPRRAPRTWLAAAAVVAILTAAAVALVLGRGSSTHTPPAHPTSPTPTPTPTTSTPAPPSPHAVRKVALTRITMGRLPGYRIRFYESDPGHRVVGLRRDGDQGFPPGCNGCGTPPPSTLVLVYDRGRFHLPAKGWSPLPVAGHAGYLGTTKWAGTFPVPSVAWQFRPGRWAVVQGLDAATQGTAELQRIAAAVRPAADQPVELPFRLGFLPAMRVDVFRDERPSGYALEIMGSTRSGRQVDITLWSARRSAGRYDTTGAARVTIDGLPGWFSYDNGVAVPLHDGLLVLGIAESDGPPTAQDRADLRRVVDNITWANGDGRAPLIPADRAIP